MLYQNQQINYRKEQQEIKKYLLLIQELGKDTSRIELALTKINEELEEELNQVYQDMNDEKLMENPLIGGRIEWCYLNAIEKLSKIKKLIINEYNTDITINSSINELEISIKTLTKKNLKKTIELLSNTINLISSISNDTIIDKSLLDKFYGLTYQLIKLELIYTNNSTLLDTILKSEVSITNVEKYLLEEIHSLDLTKAENEPIRKRYNELKTMTLDNNFLDYELLNLLKFHHNEKYLLNLAEELLNKNTSLEQYQNEMTRKAERKQQLEKALDETKQKKKSATRRMLKYSRNTALALTACISLVIFSKKVSMLKYIPKYTTTYNVNKDKVTTTKDETWIGHEHTDTKTITKYYPFQEISNHQYYQKIWTYDISSLNYDNIKDYATIDLEHYNYDPSVREIFINETPSAEDWYQEPQYIITEIHYDQDHIFPQFDPAVFFLILAVTESIYASFLMFIILELKPLILELKPQNKKDNKSITKIYKELLTHKEKLLELETELTELNQSLFQLTSNYESLSNEIASSLKYLPQKTWDSKELTKVRKRIKEMSLSENNSNEIKN